jgi:hypothetical protein
VTEAVPARFDAATVHLREQDFGQSIACAHNDSVVPASR